MKNFLWLVTIVSLSATVLYTTVCRVMEANRDFR